jgi:hypothetical protein
VASAVFKQRQVTLTHLFLREAALIGLMAIEEK